MLMQRVQGNPDTSQKTFSDSHPSVPALRANDQ